MCGWLEGVRWVGVVDFGLGLAMRSLFERFRYQSLDVCFRGCCARYSWKFKLEVSGILLQAFSDISFFSLLTWPFAEF